jgi:V/A-type H+-transporting ATPase subunit I
MNHVTIVVLRADMPQVLADVARAGVLHAADLEETDDWAKSLVRTDVQRLLSLCEERRSRLTGLTGQAPEASAPPGAPYDFSAGKDLKEVDAAIADIEAAVGPLLDEEARMAARLAQAESNLTQLDALVPSGVPLRGLLRSSAVFTAVGTVPQRQLPKLDDLLEGVTSVLMPLSRTDDEVTVAVIVLRKDKAALTEALGEVGFAESALPSDLASLSAEGRDALAEEVRSLQEEQARNEIALRTARGEALPKSIELLKRLDATTLKLRIEASCRLTEKTCAFAGWVPKARTAALIDAINENTQGRAIAQVEEASTLEPVKDGTLEVPVLFRRSALLEPFALLTEGFAVPTYTMIDPTFFVAVTFLLMFGMMFGDIGHGLVLCALGAGLLVNAPAYRKIALLAVYCGAASVVFGVLYGSVFGIEDWLPALWTKPLEGITDLFTFAVGFGIIVVSLGILLNTINAIRAHTFWTAFFDGAGPLAGVIYWTGIGLVVKLFFSAEHGRGLTGLAAVFAGALTIFFFKGPLLRLFGKSDRAFPEGMVTYVMEEVVEVMEVLMGYLANTVSFIRVAAFGLAHAGLFVAVFSLADTVSHAPGGRLLSLVIVVVGNVLIIVLEGVVVTIQALRLEYYEFFGKFFKQSGQKYAPVGRSSGPSDAAN